MKMNRDGFANLLGSKAKLATANVFLVANAFVWYLSVFSFLRNALSIPGKFSGSESLSILGINFLGVGISAFLSSYIIYRYQRRLSFLRYWMLFGVALSLAPLVINLGTFTSLMTISALLGVYFGIGMPVCMGYFAAETEAGNRARMGGFIILLIGVGFLGLNSFGSGDVGLTALVLGLWRGAGLIVTFLLKPTEKQIVHREKMSYRSVIANKSFLLYFVPWVMFSLVNDLTFPVNQNYFPAEFIRNSAMIENILAGVFGVFGGFFADAAGRKRLTLAGFALLGVGYGALGLFPGNEFVWWFYTSVDGVAWGFFSMIFLITVWGDLAQGKSSEKLYALGSVPYLLSNFTRLTLGSYVAATVTTEATVFSFASFFIFIAVLPLFYAPETLPEKTMKDRELKHYIEKAKKEVAKAHEQENDDKQCEDKDEEDVEFQVNQEDDEKARQLAEKYY
jgi:MFS family permease